MNKNNNVVPLRPEFPILKFHPLADVLPLMEGAEYDDLVASIRVHGQRDPIVVSDGMILDGRNRYRACCDCGRPPIIKDLQEIAGESADARQYVIDKNLLRRHLTASQRGFYMAQYATYQRGDAEAQRLNKLSISDDGRARPSQELTNAEARAMAQVGETVLKQAKIVLKEGSEEEKNDVRDGRRSVRAVATEIKTRRPQPEPVAKPLPEPDPPPDGKALVGARLTVPDGLLASEWCRKGMLLEEVGKGTEQAAKEIGMSERAYRWVRDIVLLAEHPGLNANDQKIAREALDVLNNTRMLARAHGMIQGIADRLWGPKGMRNGGERRRLEQFEDAIALVLSVSSKSRDLEIPYLTDERASEAITHLKAARSALGELIRKIEDTPK